jgi:hypothetical protein
MYYPRSKKMYEHEKKLKKKKGKLPAKAGKVQVTIVDLFDKNWGSDFTEFLKRIVKDADEKKIKKTEKILDEPDSPPFVGTTVYGHMVRSRNRNRRHKGDYIHENSTSDSL